MPEITVTYFDGRGRAEPTRLALVLGGIDFKDVRIKGEEFMKMKQGGELMFGSLPVMDVDGVQYSQSDAMLRYAGSIADLYPEDPLDAMKVDVVVGALEDMTIAAFADNSPEGRAKFVEEAVLRYFGPIDEMLKKSGGPYLLGSKVSIADLKLYVSWAILKGGAVDHVPTDVLDQFAYVMICVKRVEALDKVKEWNAKH